MDLRMSNVFYRDKYLELEAQDFFFQNVSNVLSVGIRSKTSIGVLWFQLWLIILYKNKKNKNILK